MNDGRPANRLLFGDNLKWLRDKNADYEM